MRRYLLAAAAALLAFAGASVDWPDGDLRWSAFNRTLRHWDVVEAVHVFKPACAVGFIGGGGGPCGGATSYTMTGPATGKINQAGTFTDQSNGSTAATATPADGGHGGVFTPTSVTLDPGGVTFTYTPLQVFTGSITSTNSGALTNPGAVAYSVSNTTTDGYPGFTGGLWQDNGTTHSTGGAGDPFGGANTATLTEDGTTNFHYLFENFTLTANITETHSVFVKRGSGSRDVSLNNCESGFSSCFGGIFDPGVCTFLSDSSHGVGVLSGHPTLLLSNGWCLIQITGNVGNFTNQQITIDLTNGTSFNYTGDATSSMKISYGVVTQ